MKLKSKRDEEKLPVPPPTDSVAASEISLYRNVLKIKNEHELENLGISFWDAQTTIQWSYNADHYFHAASTMKLAVLLGVFREIDRGELAYWMITKSSNLATNLLVDVIGIDTIQFALDELDIDGVRVLRGVEDQAAFAAGLNNEVTANGLLKMLRVIADGKAFSEEACKEMMDIMLDQQYRSGIPAGLPKAARVAHKTGNISTVHHDAGIVFLEDRKPYVLVILTQFGADKGRGTAVADVSRDIYNTLAGLTYE